MNWFDLTAFRVVAEELSFTRAAQRMHLSVASVSDRVRRLEKTIGVTLFLRSTAKVELTDEGRLLLGTAIDMHTRWDQLREEVRSAADLALPDIERPLRMGFYRANPKWIWERITALAPELTWERRYYNSTATGLDDLRSGEIDFLVWQAWYGQTAHPALNLAGVQSGDIAHDDAWAIVGEHHPAAGSTVALLDDLLAYDWVAPSDDVYDVVKKIISELSGTPVRFVHHTESPEVTDDLLRQSTAVDFGPPANPPSPGIVRVPFVPAFRFRYALSWRSHALVDALGPRVLQLYRLRYAEKAALWNPGHWERMRARRDDYPWIPFADFDGNVTAG